MKKTLIIIPSRLDSKRFPKKVLANIDGKPLIQRVYEQAQQSVKTDVYAAVCCDQLKTIIENFGGKAIVTDPHLPSGTHRVHQASKSVPLDVDYIINIQGDMAFFPLDALDKILSCFDYMDIDIATAVCPIDNDRDIQSSNIVKAVFDPLFSKPFFGRILYFSRQTVPFIKDPKGFEGFYSHVGIYIYKKHALETFMKNPVSKIALQEDLEQLTALSLGLKFGGCVLDQQPICIDVESDLDKL
jgi:3-deoxy-manno-octulosonate cytidylyltransferase (CMP-KDO synthetase)